MKETVLLVRMSLIGCFERIRLPEGSGGAQPGADRKTADLYALSVATEYIRPSDLQELGGAEGL
jgi:hypothetical protein